MQPLVEPEAVSALLAIQSGHSSWALPSTAVASVEAFEPGSSDDALDLLQFLGAPVEAAGEARVLVVQAFGERLRVLARGALRLLDPSDVSVLPLPAALQKDSPLISHVGVVAGVPALFVISPARLLSALRAAPSSSVPQESAQGSSC
jgi:hypothetical protein